MIYLQITTRCNMKCAHCGMACTKKGQDMSLETFRNALKEFGGDLMSIGGGEPTIHPQFWQMLGECIADSGETVWMATNGKETKTALALAKLAQKGVLIVELSQDPYHEKIDQTVVEAFQRDSNSYSRNENDCRGIRNTSGALIKAGRCKTGSNSCICNGIMIKPNGDVKACGCKNAPTFGNVNKKVTIPNDEWDTNECYRNQRASTVEEWDAVTTLGGDTEDM